MATPTITPRANIDKKTLQFVFDVHNVQFNFLGDYNLKLSVHSLYTKDYRFLCTFVLFLYVLFWSVAFRHRAVLCGIIIIMFQWLEGQAQ